MSSYHLSQTIGHAGKAGPHAGYILRIGDYAPGGSKGKGLEDLEATGSGNMPAWAVANPAHFWQAADLGEVATGVSVRPLLDEKGRPLRGDDGKVIKVQQKNRGQAYKEVEVALPRELNAAQRLALVRDWIAQEVGDRHAYTFAVHVPKAKIEGGDQPHLHLMYSERLLDGIARDPDQYFRRYRPKNPDKGGCQKASSGKTAEENKDELKLRRERWAVLQNRHLEAAGIHEHVDHRSNAARGIVEVPERHLGPRAFDRQRAQVLAERQVKALVRVAKAELCQADIELEMELQAQAECNWIAAEEQAEADDRARVEHECQVIEREQAQKAAAAAQIEREAQAQAERRRLAALAHARQEHKKAEQQLAQAVQAEGRAGVAVEQLKNARDWAILGQQEAGKSLLKTAPALIKAPGWARDINAYDAALAALKIASRAVQAARQAVAEAWGKVLALDPTLRVAIEGRIASHAAKQAPPPPPPARQQAPQAVPEPAAHQGQDDDQEQQEPQGQAPGA